MSQHTNRRNNVEKITQQNWEHFSLLSSEKFKKTFYLFYIQKWKWQRDEKTYWWLKNIARFSGGLVVKDPLLSLLWLRSLQWHRFDPWPWNFLMLWIQPKKNSKNIIKGGKFQSKNFSQHIEMKGREEGEGKEKRIDQSRDSRFNLQEF